MALLSLLHADIWREICKSLSAGCIWQLFACGDKSLIATIRRSSHGVLAIEFDPSIPKYTGWPALSLIKAHGVVIRCKSNFIAQALNSSLPHLTSGHLRVYEIQASSSYDIEAERILESSWEALSRLNLTTLALPFSLPFNNALPTTLTMLKVAFPSLSDLTNCSLPRTIETLHTRFSTVEIGDFADVLDFLCDALPSLEDLSLTTDLHFPDGDPDNHLAVRRSLPCLKRLYVEFTFQDCRYYYSPLLDFSAWSSELASVTIKCVAEYRLILPRSGCWTSLTLMDYCFNAIDILRGHEVAPEVYMGIRELTLVNHDYLCTSRLDFPPNLRSLTLRSCSMEYESVGLRLYKLAWSFPFFPYYKLPPRLERLLIKASSTLRRQSGGIAAESAFRSYGDETPSRRPHGVCTFRMDKHTCNHDYLPCHETLKTLILDGDECALSRSAFGLLPRSLTHLQASSPMHFGQDSQSEYNTQLSEDGVWTPELLADLFTGRLPLPKNDLPALDFHNLVVMNLEDANWYPSQKNAPSDQCRSDFYYALEGNQIKIAIVADWIVKRIASRAWTLPKSR